MPSKYEPLDPRTGCRITPLQRIAEVSGADLLAVQLVFALIRQNTVKEVALAFGKSREYVTEAADAAVAKIVAVRHEFINFGLAAEIDGNPFVDVNGIPTIGSVDTVPVFVPSGQHFFQPKYQDNVVKFLVAVTHHGYVMFVSPPYTGSSHDAVIADDCRFFKLAAEAYPFGAVLADGIFTTKQAPNVIIPPRRKETEACPQKAKEAKFLSHYRSRIEHVFGSGAGIARFKKLTRDRWSRSMDLLWPYFVAALVYRNAEIRCHHGFRGLYGVDESTPDVDDELMAVAEPKSKERQRPAKKRRIEAVNAQVRHPMLPDPPVSPVSHMPLSTAGYALPPFRPFATGQQEGSLLLFNFGITNNWQLQWVLKNFQNEEISSAILGEERRFALMFLLITMRREWNLPNPKRKGKFVEWLSGRVEKDLE